MNLSINFGFFSNYFNLYSNSYPKIKKNFLYFKLTNSKFARDLQNTQSKTQNPNTQKIENTHPKLNLLVLEKYKRYLEKYQNYTKKD